MQWSAAEKRRRDRIGLQHLANLLATLGRRGAEDTAAEKAALDVIALVEIEREIDHFIDREPGAGCVTGAAVLAIRLSIHRVLVLEDEQFCRGYSRARTFQSMAASRTERMDDPIQNATGQVKS